MPCLRYLEKQAKPSELENREKTPQHPCEVSSPKTTTSSTEEESISKPGERPENKYNREIQEFWDDFKHDPLFANMVKFKVKKRHLKNYKKNINTDEYCGL